MDVIVTHTNADFDALASLVAASILYPEGLLAMPGSCESVVDEFLNTYQHHIPLVKAKKIPLEAVTRLILVDTRQPGRIGKFRELVGGQGTVGADPCVCPPGSSRGIPIHIFDHHPAQPGDITGELMMIREAGATTTILLEEIIRRGILERTAIIPKGRETDRNVCPTLREAETDRNVCPTFRESETDRNVCPTFREAETDRNVCPTRVLPISPIQATIFALGIYEDTGSLTFPTTTPADIQAVATLVSCGANLEIVSDYINKEPTPKQVIALSDLLKSQKAYLLHGRLILIVKAVIPEYAGDLSILTHKIMDMEKPSALFCLFEMDQKIWVVARSRDTAVNIAEILKAIDGGGHVCAGSGVIRNKSILEVEKILFREIERVTQSSLRKLSEEHLLSCQELRQIHSIKPWIKKLPIAIQNLFQKIGQVGDLLGYPVFVVGGFVRDMLLEKDNFDIDIVVEGDGICFANEFVRKTESRCTIHQRFKTAVITLPNGFKIDIATARREHYEHPAALPRVEKSPVIEDLVRRDFSINAMAIQLNGDNYGSLIDFFGGERDIKNKIIRVLHTKSFIDDPTRIFRAVRFETRLGFHLDDLTKDLILEAVSDESLFKRLANQRVRDELIQILNDEKPQTAIYRLGELGVLKYIHPAIIISKRLHHLLEKVMESLFYFELIVNKQDETRVEHWLIYFLALTDNLKLSQTQEVILHLKFTRAQQEKVLLGKKEAAGIINHLRLRKNLNPSDVYRLLNKMSMEAIIFVVAKAEALFQQGLSCKIKKAVADYLSFLKDETTFMTGNKLKEMGIPPGPLYKRILCDLLYARLDKRVQTVEDEVKWVEDRWGGESVANGSHA